MSFKAMAWASKQKTGKSNAKFVLLMLADRANESGLCFPSLNKIAEDCEMTKKTVISYIKYLEERGFIKVIRRQNDGVDLPNHYKLSLEDGGVNCGGVVSELHSGSVNSTLGGSVNFTPEPINSFNLSNNLILSGEPNCVSKCENKPKKINHELEEKITEALNTFNEVTNKKFSPISEKNRKLVKKILTSKLSYHDVQETGSIPMIKTIVRFKYNQWKNDPMMRNYIQPDTILNFRNFEKYLEEYQNS